MTPSHVRPAVWKAVLAIAAGAALCLLLWRFLIPALSITAGAAALAFLLFPLCGRFERVMRPGAAAALSLAALIAALLAVSWLLIPAVLAQAADLVRALPSTLEALRAVSERALAWAREAGLGEIALPQVDLSGAGDGLLRFAAGTVTFAGGVANAVSQLSMAAVLSVFLLIDRRRLLLRMELAVPSRFRGMAVRMGAAAQREVRLYLRAQATVSLAVGALSALGLWLAGVRSSLVLGLLIGLFNLIPYFGPVLGAIPALAAALTSGWQTALFAACALIVIQQLDGMLISPRIMGSITGLSPAAVLVAVFAGGCAFGIVGMLAATPVMMVARTCVRVFVQRAEKN